MKYAILFFLLVTFSSFSQDADFNLEKTLNRYDAYFEMPRESLYLHLNKSSYLRGETLWFQGYAYDRRNQKLSQDVRNVELRVYNSEGRMLDKQLLLAIDGKFFGQLKIDDDFQDGVYFIKAETNWMKNFEEDYVHVQQFEVLNTKQELNITNTSYDLQLLPEGGYLVDGLKGNIALKLINQDGLGVAFDAKLMKNNTVVNSTTSNQFGHASLPIFPEKGNLYKVVVKLPNNKTIEQPITEIESYGHVLTVNNSRKEQTIITVGSQMRPDFDYTSNNYELVVHKEGDRFSFPIELSETQNEVTKTLDKSYLFTGVNTLTLMFNGKPVAERLIFNRTNTITNANALDVTSVRNTQNDSMTLKLSMPVLDEKAYMSVSVLPKNSISYQKNKNIISTFLLDPFVNGFIENRGYYFNEPNTEKDYNLDLLLLTQGWSKYDWNTIYNHIPELTFERKDGLKQTISINGKIPGRAKQLIMFNTIYNNEQVFSTDSIYYNSIVLNNRYPFVGEQMEFSYFTKNEKYKKPKLAVGTLTTLYDDELDLEYFSPSICAQRAINFEADNKQLYANFLSDVELDEVIVNIEEEETDDEENYVSSVNAKKVKVDENLANLFPFFEDYLAYRGLVLDENGIRFLGRSSLNGNNSPAVYLNGIFLNNYYQLLGTRTSDYEEIILDRTGIGQGMLGGAGVIRLKYRISPIFTEPYGESFRTPYTKIEIKNGFMPPKTFYNPEYSFYNSEAFQMVGTIDWTPNVTIDADGEYYLDMVDTGLDEMTLYIEGITEDGMLIYINKDYSSIEDLQNP